MLFLLVCRLGRFDAICVLCCSRAFADILATGIAAQNDAFVANIIFPANLVRHVVLGGFAFVFGASRHCGGQDQ